MFPTKLPIKIKGVFVPRGSELKEEFFKMSLILNAELLRRVYCLQKIGLLDLFEYQNEFNQNCKDYVKL